MTDNIKKFIGLVAKEDLSKAQELIKDTLNEKLGIALNTKFEEYAPSVFEALDPVGKEDEDVDNDGDSDETDSYLKNRREAIGKAMGKDDKNGMESDEEQSGEEEEEDTEDEDGDEESEEEEEEEEK